MTSLTSVDGPADPPTENRHSLLLRKIGSATARRRRLTLPTILFIAGSIVLPVGLVLLVVGWIGVGHSVFLFNQLSYLASGCLFGLGLIIIGGFLYFTHWQAQTLEEIRAGNRAAQQRHEELLSALRTMGGVAAAPATATGAPAGLVVTGTGTLVHRSDCTLVRSRSVRAVTAAEAAGYRPCNVCRPLAD